MMKLAYQTGIIFVFLCYNDNAFNLLIFLRIPFYKYFRDQVNKQKTKQKKILL